MKMTEKQLTEYTKRTGIKVDVSEADKQPVGDAVFTIPAMMCAARTKGKIDRTKPLVPKLVGYYTRGKTPNWSRESEYNEWKDHVRAHAPALPQASKDRPVRVDTYCYFGNGVHGDPENTRKGIVDALFRHQVKGGDKYVYGYHHYPLYDADNPRVEVHIKLEEINDALPT